MKTAEAAKSFIGEPGRTNDVYFPKGTRFADRGDGRYSPTEDAKGWETPVGLMVEAETGKVYEATGVLFQDYIAAKDATGKPIVVQFRFGDPQPIDPRRMMNCGDILIDEAGKILGRVQEATWHHLPSGVTKYSRVVLVPVREN